jgi:hypothetical protein
MAGGQVDAGDVRRAAAGSRVDVLPSYWRAPKAEGCRRSPPSQPLGHGAAGKISLNFRWILVVPVKLATSNDDFENLTCLMGPKANLLSGPKGAPLG